MYGGAAGTSRGATAAPSLSDLVSQSRKLTSAIDRERHAAQGGTSTASGSGNAGLPQINLALDQLESQSRSLAGGGRGTGQQQGGNANAHYFLASAGIDAFNLSQNVNQTNIASAFEPLEPLQDTDVQGYLQHEQQQIILSAIDEGRRETLDDFNRSLARTMHARWSRQKKRIFEDLGQHRPSSTTAMTATADSASRPIAGRSSLAATSSTDPPLSSLSMHTKLMSYDNLIRALNQARLRGASFTLASEFLRLAQQQQQQSSTTSSGSATSETQGQLVECWTALQKILGEEGAHTLRERQYSSSYSDPQVYYGIPEGKEMRTRITRGARRFLEGQFEVHVDNIIASNPSKAQLGGQPGIVARVAAFLRVSHLGREGRWASELEVVRKSANNAAPQPVWASVFHLLRTGHLQQALAHAEEYEEGLRRSDAGFLGWFREWIESGGTGLARSSRDRFYAEYNARFRNLAVGGGGGGVGDASGVDPYKIALYRLIGRVDATRKFPSALTKSTENWLWLQLMMTREPTIGGLGDGDDDAEDAAIDSRDRYTLEDLARKLRSYGEKHFDPKGRRPLHYFLVLLLCGEFERAVAFLYARVQHQADAVHFAIALAYYGLLRLPAAGGGQQHQLGRSFGGGGSDALIIDTTNPTREVATLDFSRLITRYIRLFSTSDARSALEYLYLICLPISGDGNASNGVPLPVQAEQRERCYSAIKDLVCQTRMYADLVGDVRVDGARVPGAIEESLPLLKMQGVGGDEGYLRNIVQAAAAQSEGARRMRDAILLYNLAGDYERVVKVLNRELGESLFADTNGAAAQGQSQQGQGQQQQASGLKPHASLSATDSTPSLALAVLDSYESQPHILRRTDSASRATCRLLLSLHHAVFLVRSASASASASSTTTSGNEHGAGVGADQLEKALSVLENTDLFPLSADSRSDIVHLSRRAESFFRNVDEPIARNLSELLLLTMDVLYRVHARLKRAREENVGGVGGGEGVMVGGEAREGRLLEVRNQARALMMFAGMLRFRIEQGVFGQLTRLDAFIR